MSKTRLTKRTTSPSLRGRKRTAGDAVAGAVQLEIAWAGRSASDFARTYRVAALIDDFQPVFKEIASEVIGPSVAQNFTAGGRPDWPPLAESTITSKSRRGHSSRILVATGALEAAAANPSGYKISKNEMAAFPVGIEYWGWHQTGASNLPQRVIMMLQAQDRTQINNIFANFIRKFMVFNPNLGGRAFVP